MTRDQQTESLCALSCTLGLFYKQEKLREECALEAQANDDLTPKQRTFLEAFCTVWDYIADGDNVTP